MDIEEIKKRLPDARENVLLREHTTFWIGGPARFFYVAETEEELLRALRVVREENLPHFLLGGGSNTLASDNGFSGLVIKTRNSKIEKLGPQKVGAEAGIKLKEVVRFYLEEGLSGMSWASGIPGTLGGAIKGNAGAFGASMGESVLSVKVFDFEEGKVKTMDRSECAFSEKKSSFRENKNLIILSAELKAGLGKENKIREKVMKNLDYRFNNHPMSFPSAGCIFKNVDPGRVKNEALFEKFPLLKKFKKRGIIPTGYLIEKAGLKGKRIGNAKISEKHSNFIVNLGGASSEDVVELVALAKEEVKKTFDVEIEEEITYLGF